MKLLHTVALVAVALTGASVSAERAVKQLFHITVPKSVFDAAVTSFGEELDIWSAEPVEGDKVKADLYVTESTIAKFRQPQESASILADQIKIERDSVDTESYLAERAQVRAACTTSTLGWLEDVPTATNYVDNAFFDCWRQPDEVYAFLDLLVDENPTIFSKIENVTKTYEGRVIPAYKISTGTGRKSLYTQALIHAREWHAGSSGYYSIASFLDGLRNKDATITNLFAEYDWYFVPILNLDGHLWTWSNTRLWRKNRRRISSSTYGVDLNRNYGPTAFFGKGGERPSAETYPGTAALSEPETSGSWAFIKSLPNLQGAIDLHSYSGLVLRPFGNQRAQAPAPWGAKLKTLGDNVAKATNNGTSLYVSQTSAELYLAYGTFTDAIFSELKNTPSVTFEMEGSSFIQPESKIRPAGKRIFLGLVQFAKELKTYFA
ncbi:hypothetical protein Poli38472_013020 [Pythium oligandrum]|uniref:Peptidase M14 domain-containing protein n=1 Tax=Pythium oligandrum TaxID=41045 RepID=A0A8K1CK28_PYTOL|nr:hypothetical protein Poli38472_013020 [Pythium oligandrum]|eukprot:TMW64398.1 hypothetical protein Poli38472_013020 [Pythium oligandrum]